MVMCNIMHPNGVPFVNSANIVYVAILAALLIPTSCTELFARIVNVMYSLSCQPHGCYSVISTFVKLAC